MSKRLQVVAATVIISLFCSGSVFGKDTRDYKISQNTNNLALVNNIIKSFESAYREIEKEYGSGDDENAFEGLRRAANIQGFRSGTRWAETLDKHGYPYDFSARKNYSDQLYAAGLDETAAMLLHMTASTYRDYNYTLRALKRLRRDLGG